MRAGAGPAQSLNSSHEKELCMALAPLKTSYETVKPGNYPAWLIAVVDLGEHETEYQGVRRASQKVFLVWEIAGSRKLFGNEYLYYATGNSKLKDLLSCWRGRDLVEGEPDLDLKLFFGLPCILS